MGLANGGSGGMIWRWNSATPYLMGSIVLLMLLIAVALIMLLCSLRQERRRSAADSEKPARGAEITGAAAALPEFVVVMAGDNKPTHLAMPAVISSSNAAEEV